MSKVCEDCLKPLLEKNTCRKQIEMQENNDLKTKTVLICQECAHKIIKTGKFKDMVIKL